MIIFTFCYQFCYFPWKCIFESFYDDLSQCGVTSHPFVFIATSKVCWKTFPRNIEPQRPKHTTYQLTFNNDNSTKMLKMNSSQHLYYIVAAAWAMASVQFLVHSTILHALANMSPFCFWKCYFTVIRSLTPINQRCNHHVAAAAAKLFCMKRFHNIVFTVNLCTLMVQNEFCH